jgi:hypothetical protein
MTLFCFENGYKYIYIYIVIMKGTKDARVRNHSSSARIVFRFRAEQQPIER